MSDRFFAVFLGTVVAWLVVLMLAIPFVCGPYYRVWQQSQEGQAELARAESNRKIQTLEAEAKRASAKMLAEAEVERAKGVAEANRIIGDSLDGNEAYLRYLWIDRITESTNDIIYVPTEAGLPILEAGRLAGKPAVGK